MVISSPTKDQLLETGPDLGDFFRDWMSLIVEQRLKGQARLSQFHGDRQYLVTREKSLELETRFIRFCDFFLTGTELSKSWICEVQSLVNKRLQCLSEDFVFNKHYLTGSLYA